MAEKPSAAAPVSQKVPEEMTASALLDAYEAKTQALPIQHETHTRGCSTYNWQMAVIRELRAMLAAAQAQEGKP